MLMTWANCFPLPVAMGDGLRYPGIGWYWLMPIHSSPADQSMEPKRCVFCGGSFSAKKSHQTFCSRDCLAASRKGKPTGSRVGPYKYKCVHCGNRFTSPIRGRRFCSHKCYTDEKTGKPLTAKKRGADIECAQCGKLFYRQNCTAKYKRFCSAACAYESRRIAVRCICVGCKQPFMARPCEASVKHYCSWDCRYPHANKTKTCPTCKKKFVPVPGRFETQIYCQQSCLKRTGEFKQRVRIAMTGRVSSTRGKPRPWLRGSGSHFWRGGVSEANRTEKANFSSTLEWKVFHRAMLRRDNYTCKICGAKTMKGLRVQLHLDHIKPYSLYPKLRLDPKNVRTLCVDCHRKTDTWGGKVHRLKKKTRKSP